MIFAVILSTVASHRERTMTLHPATTILITLELAILVLILPLVPGAVFLAFFFIFVLAIPSRTDARIAGTFTKVLLLAAVFLFLIQGIKWYPPGIDSGGCVTAAETFVRIAVPVVCVAFLSRRIASEELFGLLIDMRIPPAAITVLFRTLWLVPRLRERMDEVVTSMKLRGICVETRYQRFQAVAPALSTIFSSMVEEISENALTLTARGFLIPGRKSHLRRLKYGWRDILITFVITTGVVLIWF